MLLPFLHIIAADLERVVIMNATPNQGYALPVARTAVSDTASTLRKAAIVSAPSALVLPVQPRGVVDQGQEVQCCVSCALAGAMEVLYPNWPALAPLFHYYVTRYQNAGADSHGFLYLDSGLMTLQENGICSYQDHAKPYTTPGAATPPCEKAYADAATRRLEKQQRKSRWNALRGVSLTADIRDQLRIGRPVVLGFELPQGFPTTFLNPNFEWLDPNQPPPSGAGHCVLVVGFSDLRQALRVHDSHGARMFDSGCWWMGYRVVDSSVVADAFSLF
jgi:hypothetical protein